MQFSLDLDAANVSVVYQFLRILKEQRSLKLLSLQRFSGVSIPMATLRSSFKRKTTGNMSFSGVSIPKATQRIIKTVSYDTGRFQWCINS